MENIIPIALWIGIIPAIIWEATWKGVALWRAGRNAHLAWYICIFIFNTLGILPIIYIFAFSRKGANSGGPA